MKSIFAILILMAVFTVRAADPEPYDPTNDLMAIFGNKCKGNGPLNATAFNDSQGLKSIINNVANDPGCQGLKTALQDIDSLNVGRTLTYQDANLNLQNLVGQAANLELAISQESAQGSRADADYLAALKNNLIEIRLQINKATNGQKLQPQKDRLDTVRNLSNYSSSLLNSMEHGDQCFTNRSNVPAQIGAQMLGLASGLGAGYSGSLILTAGSFIDHFVRFIRKRSIEKDMQKIVDVRLGQALGCAFEGISRTYCEAVDYDTLLKANKEATTQTDTNPTWKKGESAIAQGTPAFNEFVNKVKAGSPKTTDGLVSDAQSAQSLRGSLDVLITQKDYLTNTGIHEVEAAQGTSQKLELQNLLSKFSSMIVPPCYSQNMGGSCGKFGGPFKNSFIEDPECGPYIYVYSMGQERVKKGTTGTIACNDYIQKFPVTVANLPKIKEAMDNVFGEANEYVTRELSKVQQSSNIQVLASTRLNISGRTALDYFKDSDQYLESVLQDSNSIGKDPHIQKQIEETQKRIRTVVGLIEKKAPTNEQDAAATVAKIAAELIPKGDQAAIPSALSQIVQLDVEDKIAKGQIDSTLSTLMKVPNSGSINQLLQVYGDIDASGQQTRNARELSSANISGLASSFSQSLKARLKSLKEKRDEQKDEDAEKSLATLCIQSLAIPESPMLKDFNLNEYCSNTVMKSEYDESGLELKYNEILKGNQKTRMCSLHNMYRKSSLYGKKKDYLEKAKSAR